ncbi:D-alanine--D-alanine ligase family protein [Mycoplasma sp. P36-A1]|uniref:D-alanine--D-alanine ligase family protein n=1 Tax=Mycoplasma sp. P36-A1 TaxID=3252900 RepID=UPI003C2BED9F
MSKTKILLLFGGKSTEHEIACMSAYTITKNIDKEKYEIELIKIDKKGSWNLITNIEDICKDNIKPAIISLDKPLTYQEKEIEYDYIWPIFHGKNGEDGVIQGVLQALELSYIGCDLASSALGMDKYYSQIIANHAGIKTTKSIKLKDKRNLESIYDLKMPLYIKPIKSGSSIGITKVSKVDDIISAIDTAFKYDNEIVIEEEIKGYEVGCAIVGNKDKIIISKPDKVLLNDDFFDYKTKYLSSEIMFTNETQIEKELENEIMKTALTIYNILGCKDYARIDMFIDHKNNIYFNEINTIPGMTQGSRFSKMLEKTFETYTNGIDQIIKNSLAYNK